MVSASFTEIDSEINFDSTFFQNLPELGSWFVSCIESHVQRGNRKSVKLKMIFIDQKSQRKYVIEELEANASHI